jgi:hypothetical protein
MDLIIKRVLFRELGTVGTYSEVTIDRMFAPKDMHMSI